MNIIILKSLNFVKHKRTTIAINSFSKQASIAYTTAKKFCKQATDYGLLIQLSKTEFEITDKINQFSKLSSYTNKYLTKFATKYSKNQNPFVDPSIIFEKLCQEKKARKSKNYCKDNIYIKEKKSLDNHAHARDTGKQDFFFENKLEELATKHNKTPEYIDALIEDAIDVLGTEVKNPKRYKTKVVLDWLKNPYKVAMFMRKIASQKQNIMNYVTLYFMKILYEKQRAAIRHISTYKAHMAYEWYKDPEQFERKIKKIEAKIKDEKESMAKSMAQYGLVQEIITENHRRDEIRDAARNWFKSKTKKEQNEITAGKKGFETQGLILAAYNREMGIVECH